MNYDDAVESIIPPGYIHTVCDPTSGMPATIHNMGGGVYAIDYNGVNFSTSDSSMVYNIINGQHNFNVSVNGINIFSITPKEEEELNELEGDFELWKKHQELLAFQGLPSELRQEIVNEALIKDMMDKIDHVDESEFDDIDRLNELRNKKSPGIRFAHARGFIVSSPSPYRYINVLERFTLSELMDAHAAASLEEELDG